MSINQFDKASMSKVIPNFWTTRLGVIFHDIKQPLAA